jgi:hypothetical protein
VGIAPVGGLEVPKNLYDKTPNTPGHGGKKSVSFLDVVTEASAGYIDDSLVNNFIYP